MQSKLTRTKLSLLLFNETLLSITALKMKKKDSETVLQMS